jgi:uncharacterized protein (DUF427 family)
MNEPASAIESVWDYPRPPRLESAPQRNRIVHAGRAIADTALHGEHALRVLETSHPPVYYLPRTALAMALLVPSHGGQSFCEFKSLATYWSVSIPGHEVLNAAWSYESPSPRFAPYADTSRSTPAWSTSAGLVTSVLCHSPATFTEVGSPPTSAVPSKVYPARATGNAGSRTLRLQLAIRVL